MSLLLSRRRALVLRSLVEQLSLGLWSWLEGLDCVCLARQRRGGMPAHVLRQSQLIEFCSKILAIDVESDRSRPTDGC